MQGVTDSGSSGMANQKGVKLSRRTSLRSQKAIKVKPEALGVPSDVERSWYTMESEDKYVAKGARPKTQQDPPDEPGRPTGISEMTALLAKFLSTQQPWEERLLPEFQ